MSSLNDGGRGGSSGSVLKAIWNSLPIAKNLPLSVLILRFRPLNLITAAMSVAFATTAILLQWGFKDALFENSLSVQKLFDADVVIIHKETVSTLGVMSTFPIGLVDEFRGDPRVKNASEVKLGYMRWGMPGDPASRLIVAVGVNPGEPEVYRSDLATHLNLIALPGQILFDRMSRPEYGNISSLIKGEKSVYGMLERQRVKIAGTLFVGPSFGADASVIMSRETYESILPSYSPGEAELGLIKLRDPKLRRDFLSSYSKSLPDNVRAMLPEELARMEVEFWDRSKPIGYIFSVGIIISVIVGVSVLFLILNTVVLLHQGDFATLMALGYSRSRLQLSIFNQAMLMCVVGYPVGFLIAEMVYGITRRLTNLQVYSTLFRSSSTFFFVFIVSCVSGLIAMRRLRESHPSDAFG